MKYFLIYVIIYEELFEAIAVNDYSESIFSEHRIVIIFSEGGERAALIIEGTAKIAKLISSLCEGAEGLKGRAFHG